MDSVAFPAPIGGTVLPTDFAPSIFFAILYGFLAPLCIYRMLQRRSRTALLIGSFIFSIERIVIFSLRATQSRNDTRRFDPKLTTYMQLSFGLGFIGISSDMVNLLRCLLVNPTFGKEKYFQSPASSTKECHMQPPDESVPDETQMRFWIRRGTGLWAFVFLAATVPGIIANSKYNQAFNDQAEADGVGRKRILSTALALGFTIVVFFAVIWGRCTLPRMSRKGGMIIHCICTLTSTIAIYRLTAMNHTTTSLSPSASDALNSPGHKACFYIFHALPEWLAIFTLFGLNVRKTIGTGLAGDWRFRDETGWEKDRRENREAKNAERKKIKEELAMKPMDKDEQSSSAEAV